VWTGPGLGPSLSRPKDRTGPDLQTLASTVFSLITTTPTLPNAPSEYIKARSTMPETSGEWSTPFSTESTPLPTTSNWTATSSREWMNTPSRSDSILRRMNDSNFFPPRIFIYTDNFMPSIQFQVPFSIPFTISFPRHSGPSFVQVLTHPLFDRHFSIQIRIHKFARRTSLASSPPPYSSYIFFVYITPCNLTNSTFSQYLGTLPVPSSPGLSQQPPILFNTSRNSPHVSQPQTLSLFNIDPMPRMPLCTQPCHHPSAPDERLRKPPLNTRHPSYEKPLPPPFYQLRPPTYHTTDTVTHIPALSPIAEDTTSSLVTRAKPSLRRMIQ